MTEYTNQTFGYWTVLDKDHTRKGSYFLCKCECGNIRSCRLDGLKVGKSKSCGCKFKELNALKHCLPGNDAKINRKYTQYVQNAKGKNILFKLNKIIYKKLVEKPCYYCGGISKSGINGLDRIDWKQGYIKSNVVPCCDICNFAKRRMSINEFLMWINKVYNYQLKRGLINEFYTRICSRQFKNSTG